MNFVARTFSQLGKLKLQQAATWLNIILQITLVIIAYYALHTWYEETRGLDKYNVARDGLVAIYAFRDELALLKTTEQNVAETALRGGVIFGSEGEPKYEDKGHPMDSAFRYRLERLRTAIDAYYQVIPRIEVVLGESIREDLNILGFTGEYYYNLGYDLYEHGCHVFDIQVEVDARLSEQKECISGFEDFNDDVFVEGFYLRFERINSALRDILNN